MKPRDGGGKAQAQPRPRLRPALLQPDEPLDHAAAVGRGNPGAVISNRQRDAICVGAGFHHDVGGRAIDLV